MVLISKKIDGRLIYEAVDRIFINRQNQIVILKSNNFIYSIKQIQIPINYFVKKNGNNTLLDFQIKILRNTTDVAYYLLDEISDRNSLLFQLQKILIETL